MDYMSSDEVGTLWNISPRRVTELCRSGRVAGAVLRGGKWLIPASAEKPADRRSSNGRRARIRRIGPKPLPVGVSLYEQAVTHYEYVDKTLLVKAILDAGYPVTLFLRPRRFGKSLNMDMLRCFFERTDAGTEKLFQDKLIWKSGVKYTSEQGSYPVIFLSFKDAKGSTWDLTYEHLKQVIAAEYRQHGELSTSALIDDIDRELYDCIVRRDASDIDWTSSLAKLAELLHAHVPADSA